jgi:hypothetical protein
MTTIHATLEPQEKVIAKPSDNPHVPVAVILGVVKVSLSKKQAEKLVSEVNSVLVILNQAYQ